MKEYDIVEVIVEKEIYAKQGVHKGMQGTILDPRKIDGCWLVFFEDDPFGTAIKEVDLKLIYDSPTNKEIRVEVEILNDNYANEGIRIGAVGIIRDVIGVDSKWETDFDGKKIWLKREEFKIVGDYAKQ
ncbi:MAG: hypothetical protein K2K85_02480 [Clostridia bacterium]|nr:hypothetical protein [Clostridia bacterium]MDE6604872.1 hypothetical protein [Clostridia bacterium]